MEINDKFFIILFSPCANHQRCNNKNQPPKLFSLGGSRQQLHHLVLMRVATGNHRIIRALPKSPNILLTVLLASWPLGFSHLVSNGASVIHHMDPVRLSVTNTSFSRAIMYLKAGLPFVFGFAGR